MSYFPDLSPYAYFNRNNVEMALNVGWLSKEYSYTKGSVPKQFIERLWIYCETFIYPMRGFSFCELCEVAQRPIVETFNGKSITLGGAEIRVVSKDNRIYASPNLIFHHIVDHLYLPPEEFIQAVCNGPLPGSEGYAAAASQYLWKITTIISNPNSPSPGV